MVLKVFCVDGTCKIRWSRTWESRSETSCFLGMLIVVPVIAGKTCFRQDSHEFHCPLIPEHLFLLTDFITLLCLALQLLEACWPATSNLVWTSSSILNFCFSTLCMQTVFSTCLGIFFPCFSLALLILDRCFYKSIIAHNMSLWRTLAPIKGQKRYSTGPSIENTKCPFYIIQDKWENRGHLM